MSPKVVLITGATSGLGRRVAGRLAEGGHTVLAHGRDRRRVDELVEELGGARGYVADLASLAEVRSLADEVGAREERLDVLVNNAGIISGERRESRDGHELTFAVNYLAGFALTGLLLPLLERSAPARVVNVASIGQAPIDLDDPQIERSYSGSRAYGQSKLAQISFTAELAEGLDPGRVTANSLHPATLMDTNMVRSAGMSPMSAVEEGAEATLRLILDPGLEGVSGRFYDGRRESAPHAQAEDPEQRRRLWELSEELTGVRFADVYGRAAPGKSGS